MGRRPHLHCVVFPLTDFEFLPEKGCSSVVKTKAGGYGLDHDVVVV